MALINTIADMGRYVRINYNSNNAKLPDVEAAQLQYLQPLLGDDLYAAITTVNPDAKYNALLELCRRVAGPMAYWLDLPFIQTQIADFGIHTQSNEHTEAAHQWEFDNLRDQLAMKGTLAIDQLLRYLYKTPEGIDWAPTEDLNTLVKSASDFSKYFPLRDQPYWVFYKLRPLMVEVEDGYIRSSIGDDFFEALRETVNPSADEQKALELLTKAEVQYTIVLACKKLPVKIGMNGFTVIMRDAGNKAYQGEQAASDAQVARLEKSCENTAENYMLKLLELLNAKASPTVFPLFYTGDFYKPPMIPAMVINPNEDSTVYNF